MIRFLSQIWSKSFQFQQYDRILILSPHPDDEIIGCAGLIQKLLKHKKEVYVLMVTGGEAAWSASMIDSDELIAKRIELMFSAAEILKMSTDNYICLRWSDKKLNETVNNQEKHYELIRVIDSIKPSAILIPHPFETSKDHQALNKTLSNSLKISDSKYKILYYWVHSLRPFREFNLRWKKSFIVHLDKEEYQRKRQALYVYTESLTPFGKPYVGELYKSLLFSMKWDKELFFEAD